MSAFADAARIEAMRWARFEAIADMSQMVQEDARLPSPDGDTLRRLLFATDHATANRMNERIAVDTAKRRQLSPVQERAMKYLARLHAGGDDAVWSVPVPTVGTLVALISRGLITASRSGAMIDHKLTEAGWAHLGM